jgi:hypothetical protein
MGRLLWLIDEADINIKEGANTANTRDERADARDPQWITNRKWWQKPF